MGRIQEAQHCLLVRDWLKFMDIKKLKPDTDLRLNTCGCLCLQRYVYYFGPHNNHKINTIMIILQMRKLNLL